MKPGDLITLKPEHRDQWPGRNMLILERLHWSADPEFNADHFIVLWNGALRKMAVPQTIRSYEVVT